MGNAEAGFHEDFEIRVCLPGVAIKILAMEQYSAMYD